MSDCHGGTWFEISQISGGGSRECTGQGDMNWLFHLTDAPFANITFLAGLPFLAVGIIGKLIIGKSVARIEPDRIGRMMSAIMGVVLISAGAYLHATSDRARQQSNNDQNSTKGRDSERSSVEKKATDHTAEKSSELHAGSNDQAMSAQKNPNDSVELLSATPQPGSHLERGQPLRFDIRLAYDLVSANVAILSLSTAQFRDSCNGTGGELVDAVDVPIQNGRHVIQISLTWSGDTGRATKGRIYGRGFLGFQPMFWVNNGGSRGERLKDFGTPAGYCYPFGP